MPASVGKNILHLRWLLDWLWLDLADTATGVGILEKLVARLKW